MSHPFLEQVRMYKAQLVELCEDEFWQQYPEIMAENLLEIEKCDKMLNGCEEIKTLLKKLVDHV